METKQRECPLSSGYIESYNIIYYLQQLLHCTNSHRVGFGIPATQANQWKNKKYMDKQKSSNVVEQSFLVPFLFISKFCTGEWR